MRAVQSTAHKTKGSDECRACTGPKTGRVGTGAVDHKAVCPDTDEQLNRSSLGGLSSYGRSKKIKQPSGGARAKCAPSNQYAHKIKGSDECGCMDWSENGDARSQAWLKPKAVRLSPRARQPPSYARPRFEHANGRTAALTRAVDRNVFLLSGTQAVIDISAQW